LLFMPGTYGSATDPLNFQVGYYTEVAGLGSSPSDARQRLALAVEPDDQRRRQSRLSLRGGVLGDLAGRAGATRARERLRDADGLLLTARIRERRLDRRLQFSGSTVLNGSQQQYLVRNSNLDGWTNGVWNQVFAGVQGARHSRFQARRTRRLPRTQSRARSRSCTSTRAATSTSTSRTRKIKRADTVVLGLGMATLTAQNGVVPMTVADVKGVEISGLIFDAGAVNSPVLLQIGSKHANPGQGESQSGRSDPQDPTALHDVFFRIGGPHVGKATVSIEVNSDDVILDDISAWRADHGSGVGWTTNTADTGLVLNGDDVIATGPFVEHYQKNEVVWNGNDGKTIMFQNEMPYDPPNQAAWRQDGIFGYAAYKVADSDTSPVYIAPSP
jgi:hypothetical protein